MPRNLKVLMTLSGLLLVTATSGACAVGIGDERSNVGGGADDIDDTGGGGDRDDCKLEGDAIGRIGASVDLGGVTVTIDEWFAKDGEPNELIGFRLSTSDGSAVGYVVKAGGERFPSSESLWMHPNGTGGPDAKGISNVDFCDPEEPPPPPPPPPPECTSDADCNDGELCADDGTCRPNVS
jgi:hypothetical protein